MQRELSSALFWYSFPGTFFLPFVFEPLFIIWLPYKLMAMVVSRHGEMAVNDGEGLMKSTDMDLSRYADIMVNLTLAVLMLFFPGGWIVPIFAALCVSNFYIYQYDKWRVLRSIPSCYFAEYCVDWWSQWLLSFPCGIILACALFKANCRSGWHCWHGNELVLKCVGVLLLHVVFHTLLLLFLVPWFGLRQMSPTKERYSACSKRRPISWFSTNPVHCLRTHYIQKHDPPCDFCIEGKEHLLRVNTKLGCYFNDEAAAAEDYQDTTLWTNQDVDRISGAVSDFCRRAAEKVGLQERWEKRFGRRPAPRTPSRVRRKRTGKRVGSRISNDSLSSISRASGSTLGSKGQTPQTSPAANLSQWRSGADKTSATQEEPTSDSGEGTREEAVSARRGSKEKKVVVRSPADSEGQGS
jgi:hypothetical protein